MPIIEFSAILHKKGETQYLGAKQSFIKRELVVEETNMGSNGKVYTELIKMFVIGADNTAGLDSFAIGDKMLIRCSIKGRPWEPKDGGDTVYFTEIHVLALHPADDEYGGVEADDDPDSRYINPNDITHEDLLLDLGKKEEKKEETLFKPSDINDLPF